MAPGSSKAAAEADLCVLKEDQEKINTFSCLSNHVLEYEADISVLKERTQRLKDAQEEIALCLTPSDLLFHLGDTMICDVEESEINEHCESELKRSAQALASLEEEMASDKSKLAKIKAELYAKFGPNRINLDAR